MIRLQRSSCGTPVVVRLAGGPYGPIGCSSSRQGVRSQVTANTHIPERRACAGHGGTHGDGVTVTLAQLFLLASGTLLAIFLFAEDAAFWVAAAAFRAASSAAHSLVV